MWRRMWALERLETLMRRRSPLVDCHRHLASECILDRKRYADISQGLHLSGKWGLMDAIKKEPFYLRGLSRRFDEAIGGMVEQGSGYCRTYCEVDSTVGLVVLDAMLEAQKRWLLRGFYLQIAAYPFKGIKDSQERDFACRALERADLLGCLPSRGRQNERDEETTKNNMFLLFQMAHDLKKPIDLQVDQDNDPDERESYWLTAVADHFRTMGYEQPITATHCISLAAYRREEWSLRDRILEQMRKLDISIIVCPSAALGMTQRVMKDAPIHNSIAPLPLLLEKGIVVGLGSDNVSDIYEPFVAGDIRDEMRKMLTVVRWTGPLETIADIMTVNGRKILGVE